MKWHLTFDDAGKQATKRFETMEAMFDFIEAAALPKFKAKRIG